MLQTQPLAGRIALVAGAVLSGVVIFLAGLWVGEAGGQARDNPTLSRTLPDWFLPIWDAYDRNPAVTPDFDFAALYAGETEVALDRPFGRTSASG